MGFNFKWENISDLEAQQYIEEQIEAAMLHEDIRPCHPGDMFACVRIHGPLDHDLDGYIKCKCGKMLMSFKGNGVSITQIRAYPSPPRIKSE